MSRALKGAILGLAWLAAGSSACSSTDEPNCHSEECHTASSSSVTTSTTSAASSSSGMTMTSLAEQYCNCMLSSCHDAYHEAFGPATDEPAARAACLAEADTLPVAGMDVESGNFVECRLHFCEVGKMDETVCPNTIGQTVCVD